MRSKHKFDSQATKNARFKDRRSYITLDGKIFLAGDDMADRRQYIFDLDTYRCRLCRAEVDWLTGEVDHFPFSRGRGGDDSIGNLRTLCKPCHRAKHLKPQFSRAAASK